MERLAQTKKRNGKDELRKQREKSNDTLNYLREAAERKSKLRQHELEIKKKQEKATMATQMQQQQQQQFMQMMLKSQLASTNSELLRKGQ